MTRSSLCARMLAMTTVAALACSGSAAAQDAPKWSPWLEFGGFYGSDETSRGEAVLWVPFAEGTTSLLFGEARGKLFEDDMREGNFALGYRQMMAGGWNYGIWGGYDIRESAFGNTFHQLAGGVEVLSDRWDFRANAYLPLDDSENLLTTTALNASSVVALSGNQIGMVTTITSTTSRIDELALWGFDAEIGTKLFATPEDLLGPRHEFRVYAGAFHFDHSDLPDSVTGPRVRAEWRMDEILDQWSGSRLTFEAEYSHDDLRDDRVEVGARLRLPFGGSETRFPSRTLSTQERRMAEGLERDTDIVTDAKATTTSTTSTLTEGAEDARTGVRFDKVVTIDATDDLNAESTAAGDNTLIIADGSAGSFGGGAVHTLQGNQTLMGGGSSIQVRGQQSGVVANFTASGAAPALFSYTNVWGFNLSASNAHVSGVEMDGNLVTQILLQVSANAQNVVISNSGFRDAEFSYYAITTAAGSSVIIDNVDIDSDRGIHFNGSNIVISNSTIDGDYSGIVLWGNTARIDNTMIGGSLTYRGLSASDGVALSGAGNTAGPNFTCGGGLAAWTGSVEFSGVTYTYATNCN